MEDVTISVAEGGDESFCLYRNIRTFGHRPLQTARQLELLKESARAFSDIPLQMDAPQLEECITSMLEEYGYPASMPSFVTVKWYPSGRLEIVGREVLPSPVLSLRKIYPRAAVAEWDIPFGCEWSSLSLASTAAALLRAQQQDSRVRSIIRCSSDGKVEAADNAPLFMVVDDTVFSPATGAPSAEFETAEQAIFAAGLTLQRRDITPDMLELADEVFYFDCRGITALAQCGNAHYMHLLAERIGSRLGRMTL